MVKMKKEKNNSCAYCKVVFFFSSLAEIVCVDVGAGEARDGSQW
jgi:hypothetical protein